MILVKPSFTIMAASGHPELPYTYDDPLPLIEAAARTCYKSEDRAWTVCPECDGRGHYGYGATGPNGGALCPTCQGGKYPTSAHKMVAMLREKGHLAMLEHSWFIKIGNVGEYKPHLLYEQGPWPGVFMGDCVAGNLRAFAHAFPKWQEWPDADPDCIPVWMFAMTVKIICDRGVSHEIVRHRPASYAQESTRYANYFKAKFGGQITVAETPFFDPNADDISVEESNRRVKLYDIWEDAMLHAERAYMQLIGLGATPQEARSVLPNSTKTEIVITASLAEWQHIFRLRCDKTAHPQMREVMIPLRERVRGLFPGVF